MAEAKCEVFLELEDPEKLEALIELTKMTKSSLEDMGQSGQRYFLKNHTYEALADKLEKEVIKH